MPKRRKRNPARLPVSQADVKRAKQQAIKEAADYAFGLMFTVLRDKHDATMDELRQFWHEVEELAAEVDEGRVTVSDLLHTLKEESGIVFLDKAKKET